MPQKSYYQGKTKAREVQPIQSPNQNECYDVFQTLICSCLSKDLTGVIQKKSNLKCMFVNVEEDWIKDLGSRDLPGPLCN